MKTAKQMVIVSAIGYAVLAMLFLYNVPMLSGMFIRAGKPLPIALHILNQCPLGWMILPALLPLWAIRYCRRRQRFPEWLNALTGAAFVLLPVLFFILLGIIISGDHGG